MNNQNKKNKMPRFNLNWLYIAIIAGLVFMLFQGKDSVGGVNKEVNLTQFRAYIQNGYAKSVVINKTDGTARLTLKTDAEVIRKVFNQGMDRTGKSPTVSTEGPANIDKLGDFVDSCNVPLSYEESSNFFMSLLSSFLPIILLVFLWFYFMRRMSGGSSGGAGGGSGIFGVGKSKARLFEKGQGTNVTFKDVAGQEGAKQEVQEIVDFLKNPKKYTELGGKIPKGALLVGPPGTGKTLLAKAVAGEADVPFFSLAGSDFVEMFVGVGASRVRDLFRQAKEKAPCIIFIDEIDAIGRSRGKNPAFGGNDERENTLNQLLTEMDGFGTNSGVIILAATNRVEILDSALLRAGRFDRQIHVDLPELSERIAIFNVHLRPLKLADDLDVDFLARQTPGFSGADIANVCNEAALIAARRNRQAVCKQDFLDAVDRIIGGLEKKTKVMTQGEKRAISVHEAGHASVSWLLKYANPLVKVTIVPRGQSLGAAWYLPEERSITTKEQMLDEICATLAGRAAEEVFLGHVSSGALNDLERVTKRAYGMVAYLGMSDELSNLCYYNNQEYNFTKPYSDKTAETIDQEVKNLISTQYERAKKILQDNAEKHRQLAELLMEREVIFTEDVERIFGKRPWKSRADEIQEEEEKAMAESAEKAANEQATVSSAPSTVSSTQPVAVQSEEAEAPAAQHAQTTETQGEASSDASDEAPKA